MTDHTDLLRRLRQCSDAPCDDDSRAAADAIEALQADNAALRIVLSDARKWVAGSEPSYARDSLRMRIDAAMPDEEKVPPELPSKRATGAGGG